MLSSLIESLLQNYCYFFTGQNDLTNEMDKVWNDPEVVNLCNIMDVLLSKWQQTGNVLYTNFYSHA